MASELKPCPFCGGTDVNLYHRAKAFMSWVSCKSCGLDAPSETGVTDEEAITYWNTRPAPAATDTELECYSASEVMWSLEGIRPTPSNNGQWVKRSQAEELLAAERARAAEKERLRFEGDLDKWMKIIGAGISGYQPEAYTLMDFACEELVKLRADNAAQAARIKELESKIETATALVTCCCGDPVDAHNMGSGHSPVDQYHYTMMQLEAKLAAAEKALERMVSEYDEVDLSHDEPPSMTSAVMEARAVLGGKP